jgi:alpha/beta superfamily hydrolase
MDNNVVLAARAALSKHHITTLRFNFRGVGGSGGSYDQGQGEKLDVKAAFAHLEELVDVVHIVAYSFGAWVALNAIIEETISPMRLVLVSPPVAFAETDFTSMKLPAIPTLVVSGDQDQFGPPDALGRWLDGQSEAADVQRVELAGVDHFYWGGDAALTSAIETFFVS